MSPDVEPRDTEPANQSTLSFSVRHACSADSRALVPLLAELGHPADEGQIAGRLADLLASHEVVLVAERDAVLLGVLSVHVTPVLHRPRPVGRLTMLVVAAVARGLGVGRALVEHAERILAARGCGLVEVTSNQRRTDAHAFYRRIGYEVTSLRFMKALPPAD
ncbi:MAG: GNAT family N-acetyltransferase [Planctomycetes bacterium]|nr:GNAT family N-acetyltransferase [Planctomycetota bacterium]